MIKYKLLVVILALSGLMTTTFLMAQESPKYTEKEQRYVYKVYYKNLSIGEIIREINWKDEQIKVNMNADLSFLAINFGGSQLSNIYWDEASQYYISKDFTRQSEGFSDVKMTAEFSKNGHSSAINNNGKKSEFSNANAPILDFNAIALQISEGLKNGQVDFEFYMQTSDDIAHYFFKVIGKEVVVTKFGAYETYRVEQVKKNDRTFIAWFSPKFDHQMVKFHYKRKILDIRGTLTEYSSNAL